MSRIIGTSITAAALLMTGACAMNGTDGDMSADTGMRASGGTNPMVGGAAMLPTRNIVENAVNSKDHTTLVAAVQAAGLVDTLSGPGPFTVFAPTNAAFAKLRAGTVDTLLQPANRATLTSILTYHVLPGTISSQDIEAKARADGGRAMYATVQGGMLTFSRAGSGWRVTDAKGGNANITIANVRQSNGMIHEIDTVLMP